MRCTFDFPEPDQHGAVVELVNQMVVNWRSFECVSCWDSMLASIEVLLRHVRHLELTSGDGWIVQNLTEHVHYEVSS